MWASKKSGDDGSFEDDAEFFGLPDSWRRRDAPKEFVINHDGWEAFELFCLCGSQWTYSLSGHRMGLNYQSVISVAQWIGLPPSRELLEGIQCLELGAMAASHGKPLQEVIDG